MSTDFKKSDRIAEQIQRKLAQLIAQEVQDPRLPALITVSSVKVAPDLSHAKVYITAFDDPDASAVSILNGAATYLRTVLARSMSTRIVPQLHFVYDHSIEYGQRLSRLIDELNPEDSDHTKDENS